MSDQNKTPKQAKHWAVIIEWYGEAPPTTWYNRLRALVGAQVRGGKRKDGEEVTGRHSTRTSNYGDIIQEGAIFCSSESLARAVATTAKRVAEEMAKAKPEITPPDIRIAEVTSHVFIPTSQDCQTQARVEAVLGRRGRRPKDDAGPRAVTCLEELTSFEIETHDVVNCPSCGGTRIRVRRGTRNGFADSGGPLWLAWANTRFAHGYFEIPTEGDQIAPPITKFESATEGDFVSTLAGSTFVQQLDNLPRSQAFHILDALLISRIYWTPERRQEARLQALMEYFKRGGSPLEVSLAEDEEEYDFFNLAGPMEPLDACMLAISGQSTASAEFTKI